MSHLKINLALINVIFVLTLKAQVQPVEIFNDYEQILPRGKIAAIIEPDYVSVDESEIEDSAWVLGVVIEGQARAYSLNLLNHHEVVNDRIDTTAFAAVW